MTDEEKKILIKSVNSSIATIEKLKFKYIGHARSFAEAMYLKHTRSLIDEDLNDFLEIDKSYLTKKFNNEIDQSYLVHSKIPKNDKLIIIFILNCHIK